MVPCAAVCLLLVAMASKAGEHLTHEEWLRKKQLEEARRAGTAPAEVDEDGREINPHIPQYISQAPWYYGSTGPSLKHQRGSGAAGTAAAAAGSTLDPLVPRGLVRSTTATRYRKGACTNCGSMTHTEKECCERPRAVGARYSNRDIMPDEVVAPAPAPGSESYDAKRDRWAGYDPARHAALMEFYDKVEQARRARGGGEDDGFVQGKGFNDAPIQKMDGKGRATVRNLRIREDTAKYLRNLDLDSAYYDPKTRSMRANPTPDGGNPADLPFAGDNFTRVTGDAVRFAEEQLFVYDAAERGIEMNMAAAPSQAELLHRQHKAAHEAAERERRQQLLDKYGTGDASYVAAAAPAAAAQAAAQTDVYVEYDDSGRVVSRSRAGAAGPVRSRWEEDVLVNNHTSVWGSWWHRGRWGYACCHSLVKNSICTGEAGKRAQEKADKMVEEAAKKQQEEQQQKEEKKEQPPAAAVDEEEKKPEQKKEEKKEEEQEEEDLELAKKKRRYNSSGGQAAEDANKVTEEQLEEYRRTRIHDDDPMKQFLEEQGSDDKHEQQQKQQQEAQEQASKAKEHEHEHKHKHKHKHKHNHKH